MKLWLGAFALLCIGAHAQTEDELVTDANLTVSYFECATLAQDPDVRLTFINKGVTTGRVFLAATDKNPNGHVIALGKMPSEFYVEGPSIDFKLGETYENVAGGLFKQLKAKARTSTDEMVMRASLFLAKNCSLLPR